MLGLTMEEGTVAEWLKREGDTVAKDEPLLMVEMDKGTMEVPAPVGGVLRRIVVQPGQTVPVKAIIAEIGDASEPPSAAAPGAPAAEAAGSRQRAAGPGDLPPVEATPAELAAVSVTARSGVGGRLFASPRARMRARAMGVDLTTIRGTGPLGRIVESDVLAFTADGGRILVTPLARRLAEEHGVDINDVRGTGPGGRITQDDVLRAAAAAAPPAVAALPVPGVVPPSVPEPELAPPVAESGEIQPLSRVRRITAERMAASSQAVARVTLFLDADFTEASRFRQQLVPEFARLGVTKLPWDALIARAAGLALAEHPAVLAQWVDGQGLRSKDGVHVGVAVALDPEGLVVPILRHVDRRSLRELSADLLGLVDRARSRRLTPAEMQDGTFTITNLGGYRVDGFTPIVNPPEAAILGVGRIADKAVVVDGQVVVRTMCTLSLSFDHRVVDGAPAAAFLARLAELLERPYALLGI
jgi:pyruvate dehydrogenase E2 component (dihydrolipoamide acetyltransferase)